MGTGRKKIAMRRIEDVNRRRVTFTKRRQGLFKKAAEISSITGCRVAVLAFSSVLTPFLHGDLSLLEAAAASAEFGNSCVEVKSNPNFEIGNFGSCDSDVKDSSFTVDEISELMGSDSDEEIVDLGDVNASCFLDTSSGDLVMKGDSLGMVPCGNSSARFESGNYNYENDSLANKNYMMHYVSCGSTGQMESDGLLGYVDDKDLCFEDNESAQLMGCDEGVVAVDMGAESASFSVITSSSDDTKLCFTDDEFAELMRCDCDEEPVATVAENASCSCSCSYSLDTSINDMNMMLHSSTEFCNSFKMAPCSSSTTFESELYNCDDAPSTSNCNDAPMGTTTEWEVSDDGLLAPSAVPDGLLIKENMEAFMEAMKDELRKVREAGGMISENYPFITLQ